MTTFRKIATLVLLTSATSAAALSSCVVEDDDVMDDEDIDRSALPDDEPGLVSKGDPQAHVAYHPGTVGGGNLKCCYSNAATCTATIGNPPVCGGGKLVTACYGCDFTNPNDTCSSDFASGNAWTFSGGIPPNQTYFCNGLSWNYDTGVMLVDRCSQDGCTPPEDGGVCNTDEGDYSPNGCPGFDCAATFSFDGAIGRMCCRADAGSPSGYYCTPRGMNETCSSGMTPHTTSAYCMPCENPPVFYDPDGSSIQNTNGAWDLIGASVSGEAPGSVYCVAGTNDEFYDPYYGDTCQKIEYICRGVQVNAGTGAIMNSEC